MQSLVRNRALVDGNKRTAWPLHGRSFLYLNGVELDPDFDVDDAENFMNSVATEGDLQLSELASKLRAFSSE